MNYKDIFPFFNELSNEGKRLIELGSVIKEYDSDITLNNLSNSCIGIMYILNGEVRCYINTLEGKEITLFRLLSSDFCLFSASCIMKLEYEVFIDVKKGTKAIIIPPSIIKKLNDSELAFLKHTNTIVNERLSDVMFLIDNILSKRLDERIIDFLIDEYDIKHTPVLNITHDEIANHLGSSREVITRMLKHLQDDGLITLKRGKIIINDIDKLKY